jgi:hypothetical protein
MHDPIAEHAKHWVLIVVTVSEFTDFDEKINDCLFTLKTGYERVFEFLN